MTDISVGTSVRRNAVALSIFALITVGVVALTHVNTREPIKKAKQAALEKSLYELIPRDNHTNNMLEDVAWVKSPLLASKRKKKVYLARLNGAPYAAILQVTAPEGYGGKIQLLTGIYYDGTLAGVRMVPPHNETPGLGDSIELKKSDWILGFNNKSLVNPGKNGWQVKKDGGEFDQFTGATITPRAVVRAVHNALTYFDHNKDFLFNQVQESESLKQEDKILEDK